MSRLKGARAERRILALLIPPRPRASLPVKPASRQGSEF